MPTLNADEHCNTAAAGAGSGQEWGGGGSKHLNCVSILRLNLMVPILKYRKGLFKNLDEPKKLSSQLSVRVLLNGIVIF